MNATRSNTAVSTHYLLRMLCEGALLVALCQIVDMFPLWKMPWGGTVSLCMVPFFLFTCRWGAGWGLLAGFVLGVLQFMAAGGIAIGWQSILGDYVIAYMVLGVAGLFRCKKWSIYAGATVLGAMSYGTPDDSEWMATVDATVLSPGGPMADLWHSNGAVRSGSTGRVRWRTDGQWTLGAIGYMCGFAYVVSLIVYQLGGLITGEVSFGIGTIAAAAALVGLVYLLVRRNKYDENTLSISAVAAAAK